jgi:small subunit ribosomal protein S9
MPKKTKDIQYYEGVGRRKQSVARVRLHLVTKDKLASVGDKKIKAGEILLNSQPIEKTFSSVADKEYYSLPLQLTDTGGRFAISIVVAGGGKKGQLDAVVLGLARALELVDKASFRPILKKEGLLMRDPRKKERRKVGRGGKARKMKQSPKR